MSPSAIVDRSSPMPLFFQVAEDLKRRLAPDRCRVGQRFVTVREIEQAYGVSFVTAQRALARLAGEGYVRSQRGRGTVVLRLASAGDGPHPETRSAVAMKRIVVLWPTSRAVSPMLQTHILSILDGLRLAMPEYAVSMELASELLLEEQARAYLDALVAPAENVAFCLVSAPAYVKRFFQLSGVPTVVAGDVEPGIELGSVSSNEEKAHYDLTRHLLDKGHRRIAHIIAAPRVAGHERRLSGFRRALAEAGVAGARGAPDLELTVPFDKPTATAQLARLFAGPAPVTAVVCTGPTLANWVRCAGGERVHLAYDVNGEPHDAAPAGTTLLIWPGEDMGYTVGRLLRAQLEQKAAPTSRIFDYVRIQDYER